MTTDSTASHIRWLTAGLSLICITGILVGCGQSQRVQAETSSATPSAVTVGVVKVVRKTMGRSLTVSSELVPFQEIDVYAKEAGFVRDLNVDYGSRVKKGQLLAVLEIPELQVQLKQDDDMIANAQDRVTFAEDEINRAKAQRNVLKLEAQRLTSVSKSKPGLVAQQEVDDAQGKDLAAEAAVESAESNLEGVRSNLLAAQAKKEHDQVLLDYSKITAPFAGVITQRYANQGTLVQAGTSSDTSALPIVKLSEDDLFRLVIPVPESYVRYVRIGDPVMVSVSSLNRTFPGKVARFSVDVNENTRTMHTEVDVPNPKRLLLPGLYADATLSLDRRADVLAVPLQALNHENDQTTVYVVAPDNKLEDRRVTTGLETDSNAEIVSGLNKGEMVVVSDASALKPGEGVHPQLVQLPEYDADKEQ